MSDKSDRAPNGPKQSLGDRTRHREALINQLWTAIEVLPDPEPQSDAKRHRSRTG
jgi:hypothetical protein